MSRKKSSTRAAQGAAAPRKRRAGAAGSAAKKKASKTAARGAVRRSPGKRGPSPTEPPAAIGPQPVVVVASAGPPTPSRPYLIERIVTASEAHAEYLARQEELDQKFDRAHEVLKEWLPRWQNLPQYRDQEITGVSVRYRTKYGEIVSPLQVVIAINVARKYHAGEFPNGYTELPPSVDGVPVKVLEGRFAKLQADQPIPATFAHASGTTPKNPQPLTGPLRGGIPIARPGQLDDFGTLGLILELAGRFVGLTNSHVANAGNVLQLGPLDAQGVPTTRQLGSVSQALDGTILVDGIRKSVDCASVELDPNVVTPAPVPLDVRDFNGGRRHWIAGRRILGKDKPLEVWKFGAASGEVLKGLLNDLAIPLVRIGAQDYFSVFSVKSLGQSNMFVVGGDSGSSLAFKTSVNGNDAFVFFGLVFAKIEPGNSVAIGCELIDVFTSLHITPPPALVTQNWFTP